MLVPEILQQNNNYVLLNFTKILFSKIRVYIKTCYSHVYTLDRNVLRFIYSTTSSNRKLFSFSNLGPSSLCKVGEIQLWLIKSTCFSYLLLQIKPLITKTLNFKFANVTFTKLHGLNINDQPQKIWTYILQKNRIGRQVGSFFSVFYL